MLGFNWLCLPGWCAGNGKVSDNFGEHPCTVLVSHVGFDYYNVLPRLVFGRALHSDVHRVLVRWERKWPWKNTTTPTQKMTANSPNATISHQWLKKYQNVLQFHNRSIHSIRWVAVSKYSSGRYSSGRPNVASLGVCVFSWFSFRRFTKPQHQSCHCCSNHARGCGPCRWFLKNENAVRWFYDHQNRLLLQPVGILVAVCEFPRCFCTLSAFLCIVRVLCCIMFLIF